MAVIVWFISCYFFFHSKSISLDTFLIISTICSLYIPTNGIRNAIEEFFEKDDDAKSSNSNQLDNDDFLDN